MQNSLMVFILSVSDGKHPFWINLVQKIKIVSLSWNWYLDLFEYAKFNGAISFFRFGLQTPFCADLV